MNIDTQALEAAKSRRAQCHQTYAQRSAAVLRAVARRTQALEDLQDMQDYAGSVREERSLVLANAIAQGDERAKPDSFPDSTEFEAQEFQHQVTELDAALELLTQAQQTALSELQAAQAAVEHGARAVIDTERNDLAREFNEAFDHALALGRQLRGLSHTGLLSGPVSAAVTEALGRIPQPNWIHSPIAILQGGGIGGIYNERLAELTSDAEGVVPMPPAVETTLAVKLNRPTVAA